MKTSDKQHERIANMTFASVYPHYLTKVTKKRQDQGRAPPSHHLAYWLP